MDISLETSFVGRVVPRDRLNCFAKIAKGGNSSDGASLFITHSPCMHCSVVIKAHGIKEVFYAIPYRSSEGVDFLRKAGVHVEQVWPDEIGLNPCLAVAVPSTDQSVERS